MVVSVNQNWCDRYEKAFDRCTQHIGARYKALLMWGTTDRRLSTPRSPDFSEERLKRYELLVRTLEWF